MKISINSPSPNSLSRYITTISIAAICGLLTGCNNAPLKQVDRIANRIANPNASQTVTESVSKKPLVVVTNTILCDLTKQIAAETIDLVCLLVPGIDPHVYKLTPAARQSIDRAKLLMYGGYNLEPQLSEAIIATSNPAPKLAIHELAVPRPQKFEEEGKSTTDPHVWHSAQNGAKIAKTIGANLEELLPAKAPIYQKNTQKVAGEIGQIDKWIKSQITTIPRERRAIFTTHDVLGYYATAYEITVAALAGLSTEEKPNAARIKESIDKIKKTQVPTIYVESKLNPQLIKTVAKAANVKISNQSIYADSLGEADSTGGTYQQMLIANTKAIVEGLGGKYTPFTPK